MRVNPCKQVTWLPIPGIARRDDEPPFAITYGIPMKSFALSLLASSFLLLSLPSAQASVLDTATTAAASSTQLYGVFHDTATNFVFVKLPQGWTFAGRDDSDSHHDVFLDAPTQFVWVKLSTGWKFLGTAKD
jgi:hypothetical protein